MLHCDAQSRDENVCGQALQHADRWYDGVASDYETPTNSNADSEDVWTR
jgi:hypothetical protein